MLYIIVRIIRMISDETEKRKTNIKTLLKVIDTLLLSLSQSYSKSRSKGVGNQVRRFPKKILRSQAITLKQTVLGGYKIK